MLGSFKETQNPLNRRETEIRFVPICVINLGRNRAAEYAFTKLDPSYKRLVNVNGIYIMPEFRGLGIASRLYKWLVNEQNFTVMGDSKQYFGARKLWAKLSKDSSLTVDLINIKTEKIIMKNVQLHHGDEFDVDTRLWSTFPDITLKDVRPILRKIS
jgi:GNAT superfamily N-acetyltransferase